MPDSKATQLNSGSLTFNKALNILVVEDNAVDQKILRSMLEENNKFIAKLHCASTLKETIDILSHYPIDIVILDLNLPDSSGQQTLTTITKRFNKAAVVVNTGAYEEELGVESLGMGAQDFLVKGKYTAHALNKALHFAVERKRLEIELRQTYEKLKDTQDQLIQIEKLKVVGGLASGVAHEVKNPLATILYGITFLNQKLHGNDQQVDVVLSTIKEAIDRANQIITDLLDFSSLSKLNRQPRDLNLIVDKALALISHALKTNHVVIAKNYQSQLPLISVDENKIEQVIINVVLNANFAMEKGGTLTLRSRIISLSEEPDLFDKINKKIFYNEKKALILEVIDTGCGIAEEHLPVIFDPFFTSRRARGGVGLGLSVSKNIMELHDAAIIVENRNDQRGAKATLVFHL